ncbi:MAG: amino acid dehydrogenase [Oceanospirillales bacterium LUC14_002_19_P2]|nr:MAG: amino acid dehydrogenase [Oceanospirillales bacterium LUC14_002_19_P2]
MFRTITDTRLNDLHFKHDESSGLKGIIAIHDTSRGPALGGCRFISYQTTDEAIQDAVRLAKAMSYKAALAGLDQGGGKSVVMAPEGDFDREALFKAFGRFVNELGGRYITAMDCGRFTEDMDTIATETAHVTCTTAMGDPAPYTAQGVFGSIKAFVAACKDLPDSLEGVTVAVQGLGHVGYALCQLLHQAKARLVVADIAQDKVDQCCKAFNAEAVSPEDIHKVNCDVFSPCGLGGILNNKTIQVLKCRVVAGSANNQFADPDSGLSLHRQAILYAPDYLVNAGGLIFASLRHVGESDKVIRKRIDGIGETLTQLFKRQAQSGEPISLITDRMAETILYGNDQGRMTA